MKIGVTRFPGTNCDYDIFSMVEWKGHEPKWLWYQDRFAKDEVDRVVIPGGFSYGDYLRCGALAARSPVMDSVREFASHGKPVLGICNGFQILCESGLLPGALTRNESLKFIDDWVELKLENKNPFFAHRVEFRVRLPIAHGEGRFYADAKTLDEIHARGQVWWTYSGGNPNGSLQDIAGVTNQNKNVAALMPHPERALFDWMGGEDGSLFL
jgi:phosphoribosylformylglycinamidine synthase